jgi:hypothetical protein
MITETDRLLKDQPKVVYYRLYCQLWHSIKLTKFYRAMQSKLAASNISTPGFFHITAPPRVSENYACVEDG